MNPASIIDQASVLADRVGAQQEATEIVVEVAQEYGRDGNANLTLIVAGLSDREWDEAPGAHIGPRCKRELVGPHAIQYWKGEL